MDTFSELTKDRRDRIQANLEANGITGITFFKDGAVVGVRGTKDGQPWELSFTDDENGALHSMIRHSVNAFAHPSKLGKE